MLQGFRVREEAIDRIAELADQDSGKREAGSGGSGIAYTVVAPCGFFKDYDRIFRCLAVHHSYICICL